MIKHIWWFSEVVLKIYLYYIEESSNLNQIFENKLQNKGNCKIRRCLNIKAKFRITEGNFLFSRESNIAWREDRIVLHRSLHLIKFKGIIWHSLTSEFERTVYVCTLQISLRICVTFFFAVQLVEKTSHDEEFAF